MTNGALILELKYKLPRGAKTEIAEIAGVNRETVYNYFNGTSKNRKVEKALISYLENQIHNKSKLKKLNNAI